MQIVFTKPELERFVEDQVKSGQFGSASEVIEAGLVRLMSDPRELDDTIVDDSADQISAVEGIRRGLEQASRGEGRPMREAVEDLGATKGIRLK
jgi:putative addiction module CopG family antidote